MFESVRLAVVNPLLTSNSHIFYVKNSRTATNTCKTSIGLAPVYLSNLFKKISALDLNMISETPMLMYLFRG